MNRHWIRNLLALLVVAALLVPMAAMAEGIEKGVPEVYSEQDAAIEEVEVELGNDKVANALYKDNGLHGEVTDAGTLYVSPSSVSVNVGSTTAVTVTFTCPSGTVRWASSNTSVATCQWSGSWSGDDTTLRINGLSKGTATITISNDQNSDTATISVKVGSGGGGGSTLSASPSSVSVAAGDTASVTVTFTCPSGSVYWASSNKKVATCQWSGSWSGDDTTLYINGLKKGSATITITNNQNSDKCKIKVKVTKGGSGGYSGAGKKDGKETCRALLIGEEAFSPVCHRNRGDVTLMEKMLKSVKGPKGKSWTISKKYDLNNTGVKSAIKEAYSKADEDDLTLFFIATHGDTATSGATAGALAMIPSGYMTMGELADALKAVPGKIIVVVESCGSGAGVYSTPGEENAMRNAAKAFDNAVIDAFAKADPGIVEGEASNASVKGEAEANTGELRVKNKFYVLTASRYQESSWGTEQGPWNYFTKWLTDGVGTSGKMPADTNKNKKLTLNELFKYISKVGDNYPFRYQDDYGQIQTAYQHVQVYPKNSTFNLFKR